MIFRIEGASKPLILYDGVEMAQVMADPTTEMVERLEPGDTVPNGCDTWWSVYLHQREGGAECIADLPDEASASSLAYAMDRVLLAAYTHPDSLAVLKLAAPPNADHRWFLVSHPPYRHSNTWTARVDTPKHGGETMSSIEPIFEVSIP